jgi:hypothetical protein
LQVFETAALIFQDIVRPAVTATHPSSGALAASKALIVL